MFVLSDIPVLTTHLSTGFGGEKWKSNVMLTAFFVPAVVFSVFFILNLVLWGEGSSSAVPFGTLCGVLALW